MDSVPECTEYQSVKSTRVYRVPECTMKLEYQSETVDSFRLYPRVTSEDLDTEPDMARRCTKKND